MFDKAIQVEYDLIESLETDLRNTKYKDSQKFLKKQIKLSKFHIKLLNICEKLSKIYVKIVQ